LQYKQLDEGPQQENTSDSGVYVCLLMRHLLVERLLTGGWDVKIDMDLRDQVLDVKAGRKQMLDIIQTYRSNGEMRRL
jgi:sentrin-specific protease 8